MRSTWTDRATGKVIDLHNFGYAGMSGWGGYGQDFSAWTIVQSAPYQADLVTVNAGTVHIQGTFSDGRDRAGIKLSNVHADIVERFFMQVSGLKEGQKIYVIDETPSTGISYAVNTDGVEDIRFTTGTGGRGNLFIYVQISEGSEAVDVTIEQLPLYPGALVSDGVDDNGVTQEAISEEVGTMLAMVELNYIEGGTDYQYLLNSGKNNHVGGDRRIYACVSSKNPSAVESGYFERRGTASTDVLSLLWFARDPAVTSTPPDYLTICNHTAIASEHSRNKLYRLILIHEQLDRAQVEFLLWKVEKEYRDWCKTNGYEYAINQLTA